MAFPTARLKILINKHTAVKRLFTRKDLMHIYKIIIGELPQLTFNIRRNTNHDLLYYMKLRHCTYLVKNYVAQGEQ